MSSPIYDVTVVSREASRVVLNLQCIHPDALQLPEYTFFAVMVMRDGADDGDPLAAEVTREMVYDPEWDDADRFIRALRVTDVRHPDVPADAQADVQHPYWFDPTRWPSATYEIDVTDPAWIQHLTPGKKFESYAFGD